MKILVTGGAGFMGSNFIKYVLNKYPDYKVVNYDKLTYAGNLANLKEVESNRNYQFIQADILDKEKFRQAADGVDSVVNYAAETHVDRSIMDSYAFAKTDVIGTLNILETVREKGIGKFIQISTDEVFGSVDKGKFTEESNFKPNSPYSASKAGGDLLCRSYWETHKTPVIVTHSCNFYGPNQYPEKLVSLSITNLLEDKKVPVYGNGMNVREWIFVSDHCQAVDLILHKGKAGEVYNIGTNEEKTNLEVIKMILNNLGENENKIEFVKDRLGHDKRYSINSSKLRKSLGWEPKISFEQGLKLTIEWYKNNKSWWKPLKTGEYLEYYEKQYKNR